MYRFGVDVQRRGKGVVGFTSWSSSASSDGEGGRAGERKRTLHVGAREARHSTRIDSEVLILGLLFRGLQDLQKMHTENNKS